MHLAFHVWFHLNYVIFGNNNNNINNPKCFLLPQESSKSRAMQMFRQGASCVQALAAYDYVNKSKRYKSYEEIENEKLTKIVLIQRNFRRHVLQKRIKSAAAKWR